MPMKPLRQTVFPAWDTCNSQAVSTGAPPCPRLLLPGAHAPSPHLECVVLCRQLVVCAPQLQGDIGQAGHLLTGNHVLQDREDGNLRRRPQAGTAVGCPPARLGRPTHLALDQRYGPNGLLQLADLLHRAHHEGGACVHNGLTAPLAQSQAAPNVDPVGRGSECPYPGRALQGGPPSKAGCSPGRTCPLLSQDSAVSEDEGSSGGQEANSGWTAPVQPCGEEVAGLSQGPRAQLGSRRQGKAARAWGCRVQVSTTLSNPHQACGPVIAVGLLTGQPGAQYSLVHVDLPVGLPGDVEVVQGALVVP